MKFKTERTINDAYLIIEDDLGESAENDFEIKMLEDNAAKGLLPLRAKSGEVGSQYYYSIRGKVSLASKYEERELRSDTLMAIINGIQEGLSRCEEYLIRTDHVILNPEFLYLDSETEALSICVFPRSESCLKEELGKLAEFLIAHTDHNENLAIDLAYGFYKQVMSGDYRFDELVADLGTDSKIVMKTVPKTADNWDDRVAIQRNNGEYRTVRKENSMGKSILILLIFLIVVFCFALCVLMLYFR